MFTKYFDIIDKNAVREQMAQMCEDEQTKSTNAAKIFRTKGNKSYKNLDYAEALKMYNNSISRAPRNSSEFGLAVANRSAVLFDMEKYKECLEDIHLVLKSEYPNDLLYKIFVRQSKCFLKLNMNSAAANSIERAKKCADKLHVGILQMSSMKDMINDVKTKLKEKGKTNASNNEPEDDLVLTEPSLKDGENPKFLDAAKVVDFKYTRKFGRHVVSNSDIKKGDVLFIEKPYTFATIYQQETQFDICSFCLYSTINYIPCIDCTSYFYCSDNCRQDAWDSGHRWECLGARRKILSNVAHHLSLSVLFKASRDGFKTAVEDESVYGNKLNNHSFVNKLVTNKKKTTDDTLESFIQKAVWMVLYLKNYTDYFDWLYVLPNRPEGSLEELYKFVGGQLVKYSLQMKYNAIVIVNANVNFHPIRLAQIKQTAIGLGLYVSIALLNHSCIPNAVKSFDGTTIVVKALEDIKKGTEISVNYSEKRYDQCQPEERQFELKTKYAFECRCQACTDSNIDKHRQPLLCGRCGGKAFRLEGILIAQCSECHFKFNMLGHIINMKKIEELLAVIQLFGDNSKLDVVYKVMKKTYHKHHANYLPYYVFSMERYQKTGQLKKCVEIAKSFTELTKINYGDTTMAYLCAVLSYIYVLAKYSITLKNQNSKNYKKFADESKELLIKESRNVLQFHMSNKNIKKVVANITKYLNSDKVEMVSNDCPITLEDLDETTI